MHDEENYDRVGFCLSTLFYSICGKGGRHFPCEISCQFRRSTYYARTYSHDLFQQFYFVDLNTKANKSHSKVLNLVSLFRDRQDVYCEIVGFKLGTLIVKTINLFPLDAHSTFSCDICLLLL